MNDPLTSEKVNEQIWRKTYQIYLFFPLQTPFPVPEHFQNALKDYAGEMAYLPVAGEFHLFGSFSLVYSSPNVHIVATK